MLKKFLTSALFGLVAGLLPCYGASVRVTMNKVSETMKFVSKAGTVIETGDPVDRVYTFDVAPGAYVLTGYTANGTDNGSIGIEVKDQAEQQDFAVFTHTIYATNKGEDGNVWVYGVDYTAEVDVLSLDGEKQFVTIGDSSTAGRKSVLSLNGNTVYVTFVPSAARAEEGYMSYYRSGTATFNQTLSGLLPKGGLYTVTLPADANAEVGQKGAHFTEFMIYKPTDIENEGDTRKLIYKLPQGQALNIRTWKKGGLTQALRFTAEENGTMTFTEADYAAFDPKQVNHDVTSNSGYETGDIFVNINERGHLVMNVGDTFDAHAMRTWELTDTSTGNYFFEPDFHYTVIDLDGNPSTGVIEVSTDDTTSPWRTIKAVGNGTAIVLVTYDAIGLDPKTMGGQYWGAIWPENTAAYVVTVGEGSTSIQPEMLVNEEYNAGEDGNALLKLAGKYVDAEHDVFYYLDTEEGYRFTFTPSGVASVSIAYPTIGENSATYTGFGTEGVTANGDGSYTVLLKHGRNIVRLTDQSGKSVFQVMTAKSCHREITNESREENDKFYAGDKVKIQYSGLFHPANKLAGIYNMSAYVTYNGVPNGTSLILGSGQYTFGSAPKAQAVEFEIPEEFEESSYRLTDGVIQVSGFGDPIGNHRNIDRIAGRSPNFTAKAHKTYFGALPDVEIPVKVLRHFTVTLDCNVEDAVIVLSSDGEEKTATEGFTYDLVSGVYSVYATADDYHCFRSSFELTDDMEAAVTIPVNMEYAPGAWNGFDKTEPVLVDGVYQISNGAELAWLETLVEGKAENQDVELIADIDLGYYEWKAIGTASSRSYNGKFNGNGHKIYNLYSDKFQNYAALFGFLGQSDGAQAQVLNLELAGEIKSESSRIGGIASQLINARIENCVSDVEITGSEYARAGGFGCTAENAVIRNCYNIGNISAPDRAAAIVSDNYEGLVIENVFNLGTISSEGRLGLCVVAPYDGDPTGSFSNMFCLEDEENGWADGDRGVDGSLIVSAERMASGEIAHHLGEAFGQALGEDDIPVLNGPKVYEVSYVIIPNDSEPVVVGLSDNGSVLYTNGVLPDELNGEEVRWFADAEMTQPVTTVDSDTSVYAKVGPESGIDGVSAIDSDTEIRWFDIQGVEVSAPASGTHGVFIRVINGRSEKVVL